MRQSEIDPVILSVAQRQSKVAMVVLKVAMAFEAKGVRVSEESIAVRIRDLIRRGRLAAFGDPYFWRWSEVKRLP